MASVCLGLNELTAIVAGLSFAQIYGGIKNITHAFPTSPMVAGTIRAVYQRTAYKKRKVIHHI